MAALTYLAKSSSRSSSSRSSTSSKSRKSSSTKKSTSSNKASGKKATPGSKIKTADGKEIQTSSKKPSNTKYTTSDGIVGDSGYSPRFTNGYSAPPGSVVYYPQHSALDYLPWVYLFSQSSPQNDQVAIVQPDGKEVVAKPEAGGNSGMIVLNWIMLILIVAAIIFGIVWGINKLTQRSSHEGHAKL